MLTNKRGEKARRHWIVFDGDVDPDWAENLNSVLDDNKILTLPSGERLEVPDNVRIMLEVTSCLSKTHILELVERVFFSKWLVLQLVRFLRVGRTSCPKTPRQTSVNCCIHICGFVDVIPYLWRYLLRHLGYW